MGSAAAEAGAAGFRSMDFASEICVGAGIWWVEAAVVGVGSAAVWGAGAGVWIAEEGAPGWGGVVRVGVVGVAPGAGAGGVGFACCCVDTPVIVSLEIWWILVEGG